MARKRTTTEEDRASIQEEQEARALKALGTPIGRALMKDGTTFRRLTGTNPSNIWVESKSGRYLFHVNHQDFRCPVGQAYADLRPYLVRQPSHSGQEEINALDGALVSLFKKRKCACTGWTSFISWRVALKTA